MSLVPNDQIRPLQSVFIAPLRLSAWIKVKFNLKIKCTIMITVALIFSFMKYPRSLKIYFTENVQALDASQSAIFAAE